MPPEFYLVTEFQRKSLMNEANATFLVQSNCHFLTVRQILSFCVLQDDHKVRYTLES